MKLLASDFDGALFFEKEAAQYRPGDLQAISQFQKAGNLFGLCTGRPLQGVVPFIPENLTFDFYILNSGALILDRNCQEILKKTVPLDILLQSMEKFCDLQTFIVTDDELYIHQNCHFFAPDLINPLLSKEQLLGKEILSFSFHLKNEDEAPFVLQELSQFEQIDVYQNRCDIDCVAKGCSKKTGLMAIQKLFNLSMKDVSCIGDSYNDLPMLTYADDSFTFTYSPASVQNKAKYVVSDIASCIEILMNKAA